MGKKGKSEKLWSFYEKNHQDKKHMFALCLVQVPSNTGAPCGQKLLTNHFNTTGIRSHLENRHKVEYGQVIEFEAEFEKRLISEKRALNKTFNRIEKGTPQKRKRSEGNPDSPDSCSDSETDLTGKLFYLIIWIIHFDLFT
jgi:hypothetical protein